MTHDVRQWLGEIKHLQQKLTEAHGERDEAFASAANWRTLYETEAQQRRTEANLSREKLEALQSELEQLKGGGVTLEYQSGASETIEAHVNTLKTAEALKQELIKALIECDRLTQALKTEQNNHTQTRKSLTAALGDAVDLLAKERAFRAETEGSSLPLEASSTPVH